MQFEGARWRTLFSFDQGLQAMVLGGLVCAGAVAPSMAAAPKAKVKVASADARPALSATPPALPAGDPVAGFAKSNDERCQECHGVDGHGAGHSNGPEGKFAKLGGQHPAYLIKQIQNFRSGERKHDVMTVVARHLDDADLVDIVAYFSSQRPMKGDGLGDKPVGRQLFQQGDATRGIAACASCHGDKGQGSVVGQVVSPVIGGQEWRYLDKQLREWRTGDRRNSPGGVMNQAMKGLTDDEIQALADYVSGL
jgi:cytochrome c553